ncbi:amino acid/polyamine/organocation transporter (APC superfamily) [Paraburkholderia sp. RAU2J]|uniref:APC family permease n=1 Tax=Paraburkholderia sp. RAU2J TaxID=1938810 RepID=UPI000F27AC96|nr:amino acid permease [Paraburkholderia sp. RAU2J]RKT27578.1 amino acid/polyamine/organocation transporter (APC superfamily) [Paraburkholderia sp. RAU2J]
MAGLRRRISLSGGTALAVGMVVGSGIFGLPGLALQLSSPQVAALGWLACTIACFPLLCIFAILGTRYASAAGISRYAEVALGPRAEYAVTAVLCGTFPLTVPAQSLIGASYALIAFGLKHEALLPVAESFLLVAVLFNLGGIRTAALINTTALVLIVATVLALGAMHPSDLLRGMRLWARPDWSSVTFTQLWKVSALIFWAFLGWENVSFCLEEVKDPQRTIKRIYISSYIVVIVLYFLLAATMNGASVGDPSVNVTEGIANLVSPRWRIMFSLMTVAVILATANAWVFSASRLFYAAGRNGLLPEVFARLDPKGSPRNAVFLVAACFAVVLAAATFLHLSASDLVLLSNQNFLILYLVCICCSWKIGHGLSRWLLTPVALLACGFLLAGFNYQVLYPIALLALGSACWRSRDARQIAHMAGNDPPPG